MKTEPFMKYRMTLFGRASFDEVGRRLKVPEHRESLEKLLDAEQQKEKANGTG